MRYKQAWVGAITLAAILLPLTFAHGIHVKGWPVQEAER